MKEARAAALADYLYQRTAAFSLSADVNDAQETAHAGMALLDAAALADRLGPADEILTTFSAAGCFETMPDRRAVFLESDEFRAAIQRPLLDDRMTGHEIRVVAEATDGRRAATCAAADTPTSCSWTSTKGAHSDDFSRTSSSYSPLSGGLAPPFRSRNRDRLCIGSDRHRDTSRHGRGGPEPRLHDELCRLRTAVTPGLRRRRARWWLGGRRRQTLSGRSRRV